MTRWSGHEARSMTAHGVEGGQAGGLGGGDDDDNDNDDDSGDDE